MSTYPAGTVAIATVRGTKGVRVMRTEQHDWRSATACGHSVGFVHHDPDVTDIRPLVVLDFETDRIWAPSIVATLRKHHEEQFGGLTTASGWSLLADQIEAQTKPPRIPEPGLWGVVENPNGQRFIREGGGTGWVWNPIGQKKNVTWDDIEAPTLIREGLS